ncbi:leucyl aminopeptidase [Woodsholea maritima]|uniref:leucyl aminopeptidase n=1 Tax=Woodsholea maritima TaxID=240237 RepID=UPI0003617404|nr:leucyl aminopeptidase [Woodsholea maritima]
MKIQFSAAPTGDAVAVPVYSGKTLSAAAKRLDESTSGQINRAIQASRFTGAVGQTLEIVAPSNLETGRVVLFGLGDQAKVDATLIERCTAGVVKTLLESGVSLVSINIDSDEPACAARAGLGARLAAYRYDEFRTTLKDDKKPSLNSVQIITPKVGEAEAEWEAHWAAVADGVELARDLVMAPPNMLHPESYADSAKALEGEGLEVEILGEEEMLELGMGALLGVGQGSIRESQIVIMRWNGAEDKDAQPLAFVGKGVTFDTGGISLKPGDGMDEMKGDMGGSAAVVGLMRALAGRKAKVNAVGVIGLVENMPDGNAQRPGDIVTSMSGQTIEILNTDAEGRLVLADALWYTQDRFKPKFIIDLATLTGAILISLGQEHAGIFSNNDELAERLDKAGKASDETVWRMPLGEAYDRQIDSKIADMKNMGEGRLAGSIAAAQFLQRFVNKTPWVHIDIAGTGMNGKSKDPRQPVFGTGYGVRLLDRFVRDYYEN